jgi:arsenate reductase (thioredoxin)
MPAKKRVLFLCTGNSARSQIAEGLLRSEAADRYEAFSAGTHPKGLHPQTIATMKELDIDVSGQKSKDVGDFHGQRFDFVITVCDRAKQNCPIFPGSASLHWDLDDPAEAPPAEQPATFRRIRDEIRRRLQLFLHQTKV